MRPKGGNNNNNNPSVAEVNNIMAKIIVTKIVQPSSSSRCDLVQDEIIQVDADFEPDLSTGRKEPSCNKINDVDFDSHIYEKIFLEDIFDNSAPINFELVSFKVIKKLKCYRCSDELRKIDEVLTAQSVLFIFFKNYQSLTDFGNLDAPSDKLKDVSKRRILVFHKFFKADTQKYIYI